MAIKISQLPAGVAATLNDNIPIVQDGVTKRVGVNSILAPLPLTTAEYVALAANVVANTFTPIFGARYRLTDGPAAGAVLEWNGNSFGGYHAMALVRSFATGKSRSSVNAAGDSTSAVIESITLPPYVMRQNSKFRITSEWAFNASASVKTLNVKFGGTDLAAPVINSAIIQTAKVLTEVANVNSLTAQTVYNSTSYGSVNNPMITPGQDTKLPLTLEFWARWSAAVSGETITLIGYTVELLP